MNRKLFSEEVERIREIIFYNENILNEEMGENLDEWPPCIKALNIQPQCSGKGKPSVMYCAVEKKPWMYYISGYASGDEEEIEKLGFKIKWKNPDGPQAFEYPFFKYSCKGNEIVIGEDVTANPPSHQVLKTPAKQTSSSAYSKVANSNTTPSPKDRQSLINNFFCTTSNIIKADGILSDIMIKFIKQYSVNEKEIQAALKSCPDVTSGTGSLAQLGGNAAAALTTAMEKLELTQTNSGAALTTPDPALPSTQSNRIPQELKDVEGVKKFQDWLDSNKGEWAYSKRRKVNYKVGGNPSLGYGNFGVNTQKMWNDEQIRNEYLSGGGTTQQQLTGFEDYVGVGDNTTQTPTQPTQQPAPGQQPPLAQQGAPSQQVILPQRDASYFDDYR